MNEQDRIRKPARDAAATDPTQGEDVPTDTDELARRRANEGEAGEVPQPPGDPGDPASRGSGSDLGLDDEPTATHVDDEQP